MVKKTVEIQTQTDEALKSSAEKKAKLSKKQKEEFEKYTNMNYITKKEEKLTQINYM